MRAGRALQKATASGVEGDRPWSYFRCHSGFGGEIREFEAGGRCSPQQILIGRMGRSGRGRSWLEGFFGAINREARVSLRQLFFENRYLFVRISQFVPQTLGFGLYVRLVQQLMLK